jgi:hypothetical protein
MSFILETAVVCSYEKLLSWGYSANDPHMYWCGCIVHVSIALHDTFYLHLMCRGWIEELLNYLLGVDMLNWKTYIFLFWCSLLPNAYQYYPSKNLYQLTHGALSLKCQFYISPAAYRLIFCLLAIFIFVVKHGSSNC